MYHTGSAPGTEEEARSFLYKYAGKISCVLGGGEWREEERSWVIGIITKISKALHIPLIGVQNYLQNAIHIVLGVLMGWIYVPLVRLGIFKLPNLLYHQWAIEDREDFDAHDHPEGTRFMRGISTARAHKWFAGAVWLGLWRFEQKIIDSVKILLGKHPDTVLQFEIPLELAAGTKFPMSRRQRQRLFEETLKSIARIIRSTPKGTTFAFHLCWGDLGGHPVVPKSRQSMLAKIDMINAIMAMPEWREGWNLFAVHEPYGDGDDAPTVTDQELADIMEHLNPIPAHLQHVIWALGVLHLQNSVEVTVDLVTKLIDVLRQKGVKAFAIATPCGMGRMKLKDAIQLIMRGEAVINRIHL
jgi:hypothetical protein